MGEYANADALITDIVFGRLDAHNVPDNAVTAMKTWLDRLPALSLNASPAAASGKALFESAELRCNNCHLGPQLTNNQTMDVGTGGAFQVPSLLGLALRGPYMHDGCAYDLQALFTKPECARSGHAQLATLSAEQAADLHAYLESL
jgi:cytochrome c